jgi:hypothetical protein
MNVPCPLIKAMVTKGKVNNRFITGENTSILRRTSPFSKDPFPSFSDSDEDDEPGWKLGFFKLFSKSRPLEKNLGEEEVMIKDPPLRFLSKNDSHLSVQ